MLASIHTARMSIVSLGFDDLVRIYAIETARPGGRFSSNGLSRGTTP
jgi:hypothetical protein